MLECTNVILSSRCNENNHSVQVKREAKTIKISLKPYSIVTHFVNFKHNFHKEISPISMTL